MTARILIVDDVPANTRLLEAKLPAEYYQVSSAKNGFDALTIAHRDWQPDLILLDVMMPGMDGFECCQRLKDDPATLHIPVVMVTALGEPGERLRGLEAGADDFLTKPVEYETLMARVKSLVRLKRLLDEWRARGETARALGLAADRAADPVRRRRARPGGGRLGPQRPDHPGRAGPRRHHSGPRARPGRGDDAHRRHPVRPDRAQPVAGGGGPAEARLIAARRRCHPRHPAAAGRRAGGARPPAARLRPGRQRLAAAAGG